MSGNEDVQGGIVEYWCWTAEPDERIHATEIDFGDATYKPHNVGSGMHRYDADGWHQIVCSAYGDGAWGMRSMQFSVR